jgi:hypothetical protein
MAESMPKIAELKLPSCGLQKKLRLLNCGVAIAEVLPSSCGIAIADSKKSTTIHILFSFVVATEPRAHLLTW